ncbi:MAG: tyrosine-protein phosphatase [Pyrinomonadaceae bacterium]|nr:tyrosine-protein phosphatase [Pyrinomonadaceae bacterium]
MRNPNRRVPAAAAVVLMLQLASIGVAQGGEPRYRELPNFHQVNARLFRGAQPKQGGIERLREMGVQVVINLRGTDARERAEESEARAAGMEYYNVPLPDFSRPSREQVARVLSIIDDAGDKTIFIHCKHGRDRTGTIIAVYRIMHDKYLIKNSAVEYASYEKTN